MTDAGDIDALAAEYVLGTLDAAERTAVAARRPREPALDAAIDAWESRLSPLAESIPPSAPPQGVFEKIEARLDAPPAPAANIVDLRRRLSRWRAAALVSGARAASLVVGVAVWPLVSPPSREFVAVLQKDAASPAFVINVNIDTRVLTVRPVAAPSDPQHSYQLWLVDARLGAPKSLGVVDDGESSVHKAANIDRAIVENATYAVSLEPRGGSPTGAPTGPVLFTGKLIAAGS